MSGGYFNAKVNFNYEIILGEDDTPIKYDLPEVCPTVSDKIRLFLRSREDVIYISGNPTGRYNFIENLTM